MFSSIGTPKLHNVLLSCIKSSNTCIKIKSLKDYLQLNPEDIIYMPILSKKKKQKEDWTL